MRALGEVLVVTTLFGRHGAAMWFTLDLGLMLLMIGLARSTNGAD